MNDISLPQAVRAAIVDLDGTMVDTLGDFIEVLNRTFADLSLPPVDRGFVALTIGKGTEHLLRHTLGQALDDRPEGPRVQEVFQQAWDRYHHHYPHVNGQWSTVFPGVGEGLQRLRASGLKLACLTNKPTAFARELLRSKGLEGWFDQVFGGDAFERKKPDPLPLIKTCEALGTTTAETVMLGDSSNDAQAARAAGCPVVLVTYGYNHGEPVREVDADGWLDRLDQFPLPA